MNKKLLITSAIVLILLIVALGICLVEFIMYDHQVRNMIDEKNMTCETVKGFLGIPLAEVCTSIEIENCSINGVVINCSEIEILKESENGDKKS